MDDKDVNMEQEASPVEDAEVLDVNESESSTDEVSEATEEQAPQEQTVPYDRFREINEEKKYYQQLVNQLASRQEKGETVKEVEEDPYANMTAEELQFYRNLDSRTQKLIQREAQKLAQPLQSQVQTLASQVTQMIEKDFRAKNKDVEPNSQEEKQIADLIRKGVDLEQATWAVMGPKRVQSAGSTKKQVQQRKTQQKQAANLETSSIPNGSPLPKTENLSFREDLDRRMREAGL